LWGGVEVDGERVAISGLIYDLTYDGTSHPKPEFVLKGIASDVESISDPHTKAATMLRRLISAHVFEDGNKRTAWAIARRMLRRDGFEPPVEDAGVDAVLRHRSRYNTDEIAVWLKSDEIDRSRLREKSEK
jgi:hypothetical protein